MKKYIVGNWKMNGLSSDLVELETLGAALKRDPSPAAMITICLPATLIDRAAKRLMGTDIDIGAQNLHPQISGAFTGEVSGEMLHEAGARAVLLGHSERRLYAHENGLDVKAKVLAALRSKLLPIICVGENLSDRDSGEAETFVEEQLLQSLPKDLIGHDFLIAYEPIWAIGSGNTPSIMEIADMHRHIRRSLTRQFSSPVPILYGGSVNEANAKAILSLDDVDGVLVGGSSLKAKSFLSILRAVPEAVRAV